MTSTISQRKDDHLDLCATGEVSFRSRSTLLDCVQLVHQALPEAGLDQVDLTTTLFGRSFSAPIYLSGMTGGTDRAKAINCDLAEVAEALGLPMGLGSQRAMWVDPAKADSFRVRERAPKAFIVGNLGVVQATEMSTDDVRKLVRAVSADALAIHLNPAMELVQDRGDRDFRKNVATIKRLVSDLGLPLVVKETGCGLSAEAASQLVQVGVTYLDVAGAGGTSWVGVEATRAAAAGNAEGRSLGEALWDWGIPTAASILFCHQSGATVLASGGVRTGYDVAASLALGATAAGLAAPLLQAHTTGGKAAVTKLLETVMTELRTVLLLCGCTRPQELSQKPKVIVGELRRWMELLPAR